MPVPQLTGLYSIAAKQDYMKKFTRVLVIISLIFLGGCSTDDDIFEEPEVIEEPGETPEVPDENPETPEEPEAFYPDAGEARAYMVDANATNETVALFYNLKNLSKTNFVVGQQDAFAAFYGGATGESDMKKTTGQDPALLGSDFMFITDNANTGQPNNWFYQQEQMIIEHSIEAYNKGMINAFTWHMREPYEGKEFYTSNMTEFQRQNAFKSILPGGANHEYYKEKLQKVAEVVQSMRGADGTLSPVIFRPFHEFDRDFFWWGASYATASEFKELWRFTVHYLRDEMGVENILYAFSPDNSYTSKAAYLSRYPGDEYVDILGMDNYGDLSYHDGFGISSANQKLKVVSDLSKERVKIAAMTETGYFADTQNPLPANFYSEKLYDVLTANGVEIGFMMFWQNYHDAYTVPVPGTLGEEDFMEFVNMERPMLLDDTRDFYSLYN